MKEKKDKIEKLEDGIKEIRELVTNFKQRNGNSSLRISNKDILLMLLTKSMDNDKRISKIEGVLKIIVPIVLAGIGLNVGGII